MQTIKEVGSAAVFSLLVVAPFIIAGIDLSQHMSVDAQFCLSLSPWAVVALIIAKVSRSI